MAKANSIRFSTKYQDDESDLLYYGYRYYKASTGTWVSRDPLQELGFNSLYGNLIHKKKSNSEIVNEHLAKLYSIKPNLRLEIEPLVNKINWDAVKIQGDEPKQMENVNLYSFAMGDPIDAYDVLGLDGPPTPPWWLPYHAIDVQICLIYHLGYVYPVFGFTPHSMKCPTPTVTDCCEFAQNMFDRLDIPGTGGVGDGIDFIIALGVAHAAFEGCLLDSGKGAKTK